MAVTLGFAGDTMLGRGVGEVLAEAGTTELWSPALRDLAGSADLVLVNLECCISNRGQHWPDPDKAFFFRAPPVATLPLRQLGVRCVNLANNHALDFGRDALGDQVRLDRLSTRLLEGFVLLGDVELDAVDIVRARLHGGIQQVTEFGEVAYGHVDRIVHRVDLFARGHPGGGIKPVHGIDAEIGRSDILGIDPEIADRLDQLFCLAGVFIHSFGCCRVLGMHPDVDIGNIRGEKRVTTA